MNDAEQSRLNAAVQLRALIQNIIQRPEATDHHHQSLNAVDAIAAYTTTSITRVMRQIEAARADSN